jgi:hypothetical protein
MDLIIAHARLPLQTDLACLQQEVRELADSAWLPHYNTRDYTGDWETLSLRSQGGDPANPFADLMGAAAYADTPLLEAAPCLRKLVHSIPAEKMAVRLMNLKAGAVILPHRDRELSFEHGEARLHIPIFTNPGVEFVLNGVQLEMKAGSCWYINANLTHAVQNKGSADRVHLVIDCKVTEQIRDWMYSAEEILQLEQAYDPAMDALIIAELERNNTTKSRALAEEIRQRQAIYSKQ